jgi:HEPN domain-containing protein
MHRVEHFVLREVQEKGGRISIGQVGVECPGCGRNAWFDFGDKPLAQGDVRQAPRSMKCPGCNAAVFFYTLEKPTKQASGWLWLHPSPRHVHSSRGDVANALETVAATLRQAYLDAAAVLADGRASAAATEARRTLEGLVKHLLVDAGQELPDRPILAQLIKQLAEHVDLATPLTDTAHAVRDGGNLGAHYDAERSASPELAAETLQLVEAVVDYLVILPGRVKRLRELMDETALEEPDDQDGSAS